MNYSNGELPPTIEIPLKDGSFCFPITEFSKKKYILTSLDAYLQLKEAIDCWIKENQSTTYEDYNNLITTYISSMPPDDLPTPKNNSSSSPKKPKSNKKLKLVESPQNQNFIQDEDIIINTQISPNLGNKVVETYQYQNGNMFKKSKDKKQFKPRHHGKHGN